MAHGSLPIWVEAVRGFRNRGQAQSVRAQAVSLALSFQLHDSTRIKFFSFSKGSPKSVFLRNHWGILEAPVDV